jgi:hypothetical protein
MRSLACALALVTCAVATPHTVAAMTIDVRGDQLVMSGHVVASDAAHFRSLLTAHSGIKTVVLTNSPGGSASANDAITDMIEQHHLNTIIGGYCVSACAMIFLAGTSRAFGDLVATADESLGFHGSYANGKLKGSQRLDALKARIMQRTDNKAPPALVDRWLHIADDKSSMRFRYPAAGAKGPLVYFCTVGTQANKGNLSGCQPVSGTDAFAAGIITTRSVEHIER